MITPIFAVLMFANPAATPTPTPVEVVPLAIRMPTPVVIAAPKRSPFLQWTVMDTVLEGGFAVALAADMSTTIDIGQRCGPKNNDPGDRLYRCIETNPILGKWPSRERVIAYGTVCLILHAAIARILPQPFRAGWQVVWTAVEIDMTHYNLSSGLRFAF